MDHLTPNFHCHKHISHTVNKRGYDALKDYVYKDVHIILMGRVSQGYSKQTVQ